MHGEPPAAADHPPLIGVCGPVGAGKSTIGALLATALRYQFFRERYEDNPFFERFLDDRPTWAFRSQVAFMLGSIEDAAHARADPNGAVIERPTREMFGVFVRSLHSDRSLADDERDTLERLTELGNKLADPPDLLIVLSGDPRRLLERIRARGRRGERTAYSPTVMEELATAYDDWRRTLDESLVIDRDATSRDLRQPEEIRSLKLEVQDRLQNRP